MRKMRWVVIFLCFLAIAINYIDRANLAVAAPQIEKALGIGPAEMGLILSGFFWTYALMQMPFGWFVDRVGARIALPLAVGWWSVFTALTAAATSVVGMFGCRLLLGVGEAGAYPSCAKLVAQWFKPEQRALRDQHLRQRLARRLGAVDSGGRAHHQLVRLGSVVRHHRRARRRVDSRLVPDLPQSVARRSDRRGRRRAAVQAAVAPKTKVRGRSLFRYRTLWGMMLGFFCLNFVIYFFITWFPSYLVQTRGFSLKSLGTLGMIPALMSIPGGWLGGFVSDALYRRGWSLTAARKTCMVGGMLLSSVITLSRVHDQHLPDARVLRHRLWQPRVRRRQHLVAARRRRADARSRRLDRRHPELRVEPAPASSSRRSPA